MKVGLVVAKLHPRAFRVIELHGDAILGIVRSEVELNQPFRLNEVLEKVQAKLNMTRTTARAYTFITMKNCKELKLGGVDSFSPKRWIIKE